VPYTYLSAAFPFNPLALASFFNLSSSALGMTLSSHLIYQLRIQMVMMTYMTDAVGDDEICVGVVRSILISVVDGQAPLDFMMPSMSER